MKIELQRALLSAVVGLFCAAGCKDAPASTPTVRSVPASAPATLEYNFWNEDGFSLMSLNYTPCEKLRWRLEDHASKGQECGIIQLGTVDLTHLKRNPGSSDADSAIVMNLLQQQIQKQDLQWRFSDAFNATRGRDANTGVQLYEGTVGILMSDTGVLWFSLYPAPRPKTLVLACGFYRKTGTD